MERRILERAVELLVIPERDPLLPLTEDELTKGDAHSRAALQKRMSSWKVKVVGGFWGAQV